MRFFTAVLAAVTLALPVFASPMPRGETKYIVKLKNSAAKSSVLSKLNAKARITHEWDIIHGFAGNFDSTTLETLRSSPDVEYVEEDGVAHTTTAVTQTNAPWGLARLSSNSRLSGSDSALTFSYTYDSSAGGGVDIYVVDTGVLTTHTTFGGRARWGATFGGYANADGNGHGTHCAGTIAGGQYGVSKSANIIAVKVLSDGGSGAWTDIISGLNWVGQQAASSGRPSVVSMSLGGGAIQSVDDAVNALANQGVHVVVAAGNSNTDAGSTSPARAAGAITVGATTFADARASFSNYGAVVAIWAPGQNVISSWIGSSNTATNSISGTSMATPHVAGLVAYLIGLQGNVTPPAMKAKLQSLCLRDVISGIPSGTINCLAHNTL